MSEISEDSEIWGFTRGPTVPESWVWGLKLAVGLPVPQACGAWQSAREGPVLGLWRCEVHVGWGRPIRERIGSAESWTCQLPGGEGRDQFGSRGSQVVVGGGGIIPAEPLESSEPGNMIEEDPTTDLCWGGGHIFKK